MEYLQSKQKKIVQSLKDFYYIHSKFNKMRKFKTPSLNLNAAQNENVL